ncbi:hypothetical protein ACVBKF_24025, partial [Shewanella sp. 0m-11]
MRTATQGNKLVSTQMAETAERYWQRLTDSAADVLAALTDEQQQELKLVFGLSDFIASQLCRHSHWIPALFERELHNIERQTFDSELTSLLEPVT